MPPFPPELWEHTPVAVREYIRTLEARVAALEATVQHCWSASSKTRTTPRARRRVIPHKRWRSAHAVGRVDASVGGNLAIQGQTRALVPIEEVDTVVPVKPRQCHRCQHPLQGEDPQPHRHQVTELPPVKPVVTEYQLHRLRLPSLWGSTRAAVPVWGADGGLWAACASHCGAVHGCVSPVEAHDPGRHGRPVRASMSLGTIPHLEQATVQAVAAPVAEAQAYVRTQPVAHLDETGWREGRARAWLWVAVTAWVTVFAVRRSRGAKVVQDSWRAVLWHPGDGSLECVHAGIRRGGGRSAGRICCATLKR